MANERKGHYRAYEDKNFNKTSLLRIEHINKILTEYAADGFDMTVRQVYYQLVQSNTIANSEQSYNNLSRLVSEGRLAGLISWTAIIDRGRNLRGNRHWRSPQGAIKTLEEEYQLDKWADQPWRPEVWVEKQAQEGTVGQICASLDVDFFAVKGYNSQSEQWRAGQRFARRFREGQRPIVFHLGDHDPSGLDMTRDNRERLSMFAGVDIPVMRLALNMPQIEELDLPPNPAKRTDGRFDAYEAEYNTTSSWELDALDPRFIQKLIEDAILRIRDNDLWDSALNVEVGDKMMLQQAAEQMGATEAEPGSDFE